MIEVRAKPDVYLVGLMYDIKRRRATKRAGYDVPRRIRKTLRRLISEREWRALWMYVKPGWRAECDPFPDELRRCGTGWTREGAMRSLIRHAARRGVLLWLTEETDR